MGQVRAAEQPHGGGTISARIGHGRQTRQHEAPLVREAAGIAERHGRLQVPLRSVQLTVLSLVVAEIGEDDHLPVPVGESVGQSEGGSEVAPRFLGPAAPRVGRAQPDQHVAVQALPAVPARRLEQDPVEAVSFREPAGEVGQTGPGQLRPGAQAGGGGRGGRSTVAQIAGDLLDGNEQLAGSGQIALAQGTEIPRQRAAQAGQGVPGGAGQSARFGEPGSGGAQVTLAAAVHRRQERVQGDAPGRIQPRVGSYRGCISRRAQHCRQGAVGPATRLVQVAKVQDCDQHRGSPPQTGGSRPAAPPRRCLRPAAPGAAPSGERILCGVASRALVGLADDRQDERQSNPSSQATSGRVIRDARALCPRVCRAHRPGPVDPPPTAPSPSPSPA